MVSNTTILVMVILALVLLGVSLYIGVSIPGYATQESVSNQQGNIGLIINPAG